MQPPAWPAWEKDAFTQRIRSKERIMWASCQHLIQGNNPTCVVTSCPCCCGSVPPDPSRKRQPGSYPMKAKSTRSCMAGSGGSGDSRSGGSWRSMRHGSPEICILAHCFAMERRSLSCPVPCRRRAATSLKRHLIMCLLADLACLEQHEKRRRPSSPS